MLAWVNIFWQESNYSFPSKCSLSHNSNLYWTIMSVWNTTEESSVSLVLCWALKWWRCISQWEFYITSMLIKTSSCHPRKTNIIILPSPSFLLCDSYVHLSVFSHVFNQTGPVFIFHHLPSSSSKNNSSNPSISILAPGKIHSFPDAIFVLLSAMFMSLIIGKKSESILPALSVFLIA